MEFKPTSDLTPSPESLGLLRRFGPLSDFLRPYMTGSVWDYNYQIRFTAVAGAGGTASTTLTFNTAGFLWLAVKGTRSDTALIRITDNTGNDPVMNDYVCLSNFCGTYGQPKILPVPRAIKIGTRLTVDITNTAVAPLAVAEIVLCGVWLS